MKRQFQVSSFKFQVVRLVGCILLSAGCLLFLGCGPRDQAIALAPVDGPIDPCEGNVCRPPKATPSPTPTPGFRCFYIIVDGEKRLVCE